MNMQSIMHIPEAVAEWHAVSAAWTAAVAEKKAAYEAAYRVVGIGTPECRCYPGERNGGPAARAYFAADNAQRRISEQREADILRRYAPRP